MSRARHYPRASFTIVRPEQEVEPGQPLWLEYEIENEGRSEANLSGREPYTRAVMDRAVKRAKKALSLR